MNKRSIPLTILTIMILIVIVLASVFPAYAQCSSGSLSAAMDTKSTISIGTTDPWIFSFEKKENMVIRDKWGSPQICTVARDANRSIRILSSATYARTAYTITENETLDYIGKEESKVSSSGKYDHISQEKEDNLTILSYTSVDFQESHMIVWIPVEDKYLRIYILSTDGTENEKLLDTYVHAILYQTEDAK